MRRRAGNPLRGKRIVLGVSGSIGAVLAPELARRLVSKAATVRAVLTPAASKLVHGEAFRLAGCEDVVESLSGKGEHVRELLEDGADLLVICPATANTIGKIAGGIDDSPLTTFATTLSGVVPVLVVPAMHESMYRNAAVRASLELLGSRGITILSPRLEEEAAKLASLEEVEAHVEQLLRPGSLRGRRVLVIAGPTAEPIGEDLVLTNRATGETGVAIAHAAFLEGAETELWMGAAERDPPPGVRFQRFGTVEDLLALAKSVSDFDAVLVPAAIGDYAAAPGEPTAGEIPLAPLPKVVDEIRRRFRGPLVCWKAESGVSRSELLARAQALRSRTNATLVVANRIEEVHEAETRARLVTASGAELFHGTREELARHVVHRVANALARGGKGDPR